MKKNLKRLISSALVLVLGIACFLPLAKIKAEVGDVGVVIAWNCDGKVCKKILSLKTYEEIAGVRYYEVNKIASSTITDTDRGKTFKASDMTSFGKTEGSKKQWLVFPDGTDLSGYDNWDDLDVAMHEDPAAPHDIDPTGGNDGPHSVVHNGDREFRLIIYDNNYKGITFDVSPENYTYYLGGWNPVFANPVYDLADSKDNPTIYKTYLLEKKLKFNATENIQSVKALDISSKGVTVRVVDNTVCDITFNSNYFSDVVFEVTYTSGKKGYFKAERQFVRFADNSELVMNEIDRNREAYAEFIYPADKSYTDYDVYATITTGDTVVTKKLTAVKTRMIDGEAMEPNTLIENMAVNAGENLKSTRYGLDITKDTKDVTITVTKKDAVVGNTYGGTFGGHDSGVKLDITRFIHMLNN